MSASRPMPPIARPHRLRSLDALRIIASAFIVLLHVAGDRAATAPAIVSAALVGAARWAVPVFFVTSAFLLGRKALRGDGGGALRYAATRAARTYGLYAVWTAIYVALKLVSTHGRMWPVTLPAVLFTGAGASFPLWFLPALALCTLVGGLVTTRPRLAWAIAVTAVLAGLRLTGVFTLPLDVWVFGFAPFTSWLLLFLLGMGLTLAEDRLSSLGTPAGLAPPEGSILDPAALVAPTLLAASTAGLAALAVSLPPADPAEVLFTAAALAGLVLVATAVARPDAFAAARLAPVARLVLGIYLVHYLLVRVALDVAHLPASSAATILGTSLGVWIASVGTAWVLHRLPLTRRLANLGSDVRPGASEGVRNAA